MKIVKLLLLVHLLFFPITTITSTPILTEVIDNEISFYNASAVGKVILLYTIDYDEWILIDKIYIPASSTIIISIGSESIAAYYYRVSGSFSSMLIGCSHTNTII